MKESRRLALIAAVSVLAAMAIGCACFNVMQDAQLRGESQQAIDEAIAWTEDSSDVPASRTANYLYLTDGYAIADEEEAWASELDLALADWCADNAGTVSGKDMQRADVDGSTVYIEESDDLLLDEDEPYIIGDYAGGPPSASRPAHCYVYVDVTSQVQLVGLVNAALAIIAAVGAAVAGALCWRAGRRMEQAQEAQRRFFQNMSHELKTPLASIQGYADALSAGLMDERRALTSIEAACARASAMVGDVLDMSRLESGAVEPHKKRVEVADAVQDCLMPFEGVAASHALDVRLDLAPGAVEADPDLLGQALSNVLSNAFRHAGTYVAASYDGTRLVVENDGEMPDPADVPHLFERFRSASGGATGIGLAVVDEIAHLHGWKASAKLESGSFLIVLNFA